MKPIWPVYENYKPLSDEEVATLTALVRKATGAGFGCGALFRPVNQHEVNRSCPIPWSWQDTFIRFGQQLTRLHFERAAEIGQHSPGNVREITWSAYRSKYEKEAEQKVAAAIARGE